LVLGCWLCAGFLSLACCVVRSLPLICLFPCPLMAVTIVSLPGLRFTAGLGYPCRVWPAGKLEFVSRGSGLRSCFSVCLVCCWLRVCTSDLCVLVRFSCWYQWFSWYQLADSLGCSVLVRFDAGLFLAGFCVVRWLRARAQSDDWAESWPVFPLLRVGPLFLVCVVGPFGPFSP
jgi:hypothetical protein